MAGDNGNFTLRLEAVSLAQAGTYTCRIHLQGQQLNATVTLAVITGQPPAGEEEGWGGWAGWLMAAHIHLVMPGCWAQVVASSLTPLIKN